MRGVSEYVFMTYSLSGDSEYIDQLNSAIRKSLVFCLFIVYYYYDYWPYNPTNVIFFLVF